MYKITPLILSLLFVGCSNTVSQLTYHKQPYPIVCNSSDNQTKISTQVIAKDSTLVRITQKSKSAKASAATLPGEGNFDEIVLTKKELKDIKKLMELYPVWTEAVKNAGVNVTELKFYKTYNDAVFTIDFYSRQNADKTGLSVKISREDSSFTYNSSTSSCFLNACCASLEHQEKMDNLSVELP